jgi:Porin PorA
VFDPEELTLRQNVGLTAVRKVESNIKQADAKPGGDIMVWDQGLLVTDTEGKTISAVEHRVCLDRRTNEAVPECSSSYVTEDEDGPSKEDRAVVQDGVNYKFPFNVAKSDYRYFDTTLRKATAARFDSEDTVNGVDVYKFVQDIPPTKIRSQEVPGSLVGLGDPPVNADRLYQNTRTMWVEPVTGIIVKGQEQQKQTFRAAAGKKESVIIDGTLTFNQKTIEGNLARVDEIRPKLLLISSTGPLVLGGLGIVLLGLGVFMFLRTRRREPIVATESGPQHLKS